MKKSDGTNRMIQTSKNFQYSVNIAYDLQNAEKLRGFIPTSSSLELLEKILWSTEKTSSSRARILIGAYGKGKSHIVLTILSILMAHEPITDFEHLNKKLEDFPKLKQLVKNYYASGKKLLPVLITGSGTSLSQSFLVSLKNTLDENDLSDFMPETNYKAAILAIEKWQNEYPEVIKKFESLSECSVPVFISELKDFNIDYYHRFEKLYPLLTAGSEFNPFLGFDVVELYESVAKELRRQKLYDGLYVVYDEFSKYLESNIESATVSDTKMLQDFAEKSCRSGENQLHLLLISHKEISNYIDKLPKQKTDGWRGISERFEHVLLNNNFSQVYEIISTVIQKNKALWNAYRKKHSEQFELITQTYRNHELFREIKQNGGMESLLEGTFPLHPVSTFILPRLSEQIAQNERTLFTFLSANGETTLSSFLGKFNEEEFSLVTPDLIFDYFEPLFKKEVYSGELHEIYHLTSVTLEKLSASSGEDKKLLSLERKIVKTISLIYILSQFEKLKPIHEEIVRIYNYSYSKDEIEAALRNLIEKEFVIYLRQSNSYLKLKETSGVDIAKNIRDEVERQKRNFSLANVLNENNDEPFLYPYRYNDEKEMTRYFEIRFIESSILFEHGGISKLSESKMNADGIIFAVICRSRDDHAAVKEYLLSSTKSKKSCYVFTLLRRYENIEKTAHLLSALISLRKSAEDDEILCSEYQVVLDDVKEVFTEYIRNYTHPEKRKAVYIYSGLEQNINRRSQLSILLSDICAKVYSKAPIINNEAINKNEITSIAANNRRKVMAGLLRRPLEKNLGLTGSGQDVAIMRSTLYHTRLVRNSENTEFADISLDFTDDKFVLEPIVKQIWTFADKAEKSEISFNELYKKLTSAEFGIGARKGIIPIYIAAVFGEIKNQLVIYQDGRQVPLNADTLTAINENPSEYSLKRFYLDDDKKNYLEELKKLFNAAEGSSLYMQMQNWYLSLPKYSRETKFEFSSFIQIFKENSGEQETLFSRLPAAFNRSSADLETVKFVKKAKVFYDDALSNLKLGLCKWIQKTFGGKTHSEASITQVLNEWLKKQNPKICNHLFSDGAERFIAELQRSDLSEDDFVEELSFTATGLRVSDWNDETKLTFEKRITAWKNTAENFDSEFVESKNLNSFAEDFNFDGKSYSISFPSKTGKPQVRHFEKVQESPRSRLLYNKLTDALETMGRSMTDAEKRQVLMNILQEMC